MKVEVEFVLVVDGANEQGIVVADRIFQALKKYLDPELLEKVDIKSTIHDVRTHGDIETDSPGIIFGPAAGARSICGPSFKLPPISRLIDTEENVVSRSRAFKAIKERVPDINALIASYIAEAQEEPTVTYVEKAGITVGRNGVDIEITEEEAEYLKRIKDLLGGGKMVVTKGDLRIEVE